MPALTDSTERGDVLLRSNMYMNLAKLLHCTRAQ